MGGGYEGAEAFMRGTFGILGKGSILRAGTVFFVCDIVLVWGLGGHIYGQVERNFNVDFQFYHLTKP
jgi:hypothetical protein